MQHHYKAAYLIIAAAHRIDSSASILYEDASSQNVLEVWHQGVDCKFEVVIMEPLP